MDFAGPPGTEDDDANDCVELDDKFFETIGQTFNVVDEWNGHDQDSSSKTVPMPKIKKEVSLSPSTRFRNDEWYGQDQDSSSKTVPMPKIKTEVSSSSSTRLRNDSERSGSRNRTTSNRSKSPDRRRSPLRRRISPETSRRRSPPRRRRTPSPPKFRDSRKTPPWRKNGPPPGARPSFLEEMSQKFPELTAPTQNNVQFNQPTFGTFPGVVSAPTQPMNFMPDFQMMRPNMGFDIYGVPYTIPYQQQNQIAIPASSIMVPEPVPPPVAAPVAAPIVNSTIEKEKDLADLKQAKKKAFDEGKLTLVDMLKQYSQRQKKDASNAGTNIKKTKVHERCKEAVKLLEDLATDKSRVPFVVQPPSVGVSSMRSDVVTWWRSPLVASDSNVVFMSQARLSTCRDSLQANPLRNIRSDIFHLGRNLGFDMVDFSNKVQARVEVESEKTTALAKVTKISDATVSVSTRKVQFGTQTDPFQCLKCNKRDMKEFESVSIQTETDINPHPVDSDGFNANLDLMTIQSMSRSQASILSKFCQAFNINDDRFIEPPRQWDSDNDDRRDSIDHMSYANPENPNIKNENQYHSWSPLPNHNTGRFAPSRSPPRRYFPPITLSDSRSPSPQRRKITERLGIKIESPTALRRRIECESDGLSPQHQSRYYQSPSPPNLPSYRIPSPPIRRSPGPSNGYRNRSRSRSPRQFRVRRTRSRSFSPNRSQKRSRQELTERRGRY